MGRGFLGKQSGDWTSLRPGGRRFRFSQSGLKLCAENPYLESIQILAVFVNDGCSVVHDAVTGHHPRATAHVRHGGREVQVQGRVRCHSDLDRPRPLVHHLVEANLEHLVGPQVTARQHDSVVKIIQSTANDRNFRRSVHFSSTRLFRHVAQTTVSGFRVLGKQRSVSLFSPFSMEQNFTKKLFCSVLQMYILRSVSSSLSIDDSSVCATMHVKCQFLDILAFV